MGIVLFTTHCPRCEVLCKKLDAKNIQYSVVENIDEMLALGLRTAPALKVDDQPIMGFKKAIEWVEAQ